MTDVLPALKGRFSARHYDGSAISTEALLSLLEAARWAPSSRNEQPWSFIVAPRQDEAAFAALLGCLNETNQVWAKDAAVLLACVTAKHFEHHDLPNRHAWHDIGLTTMALLTQASSLGLQARVMGGIHADKARELYAVPESHDITSAIAVGKPGEVAEYLTKRERKPLDSFVFGSRWGQKAGFLG